GKIVNVASLLSFQGGITVPAYAASKGGVAQLTKALANEWAARGVNVNAIAPGYIETQLNIDYWNGFADPQAERQRALDLHPPRRIGQPMEVAMTAVFLAGDEAPFINASCITVDGGRSVMYHD
ncbi:MAG: SDR family oxidoreductase, partial [Pseudomonadota bacterium]|nr:SDR family oxidoreductase [Pseudomonadota bacterium]